MELDDKLENGQPINYGQSLGLPNMPTPIPYDSITIFGQSIPILPVNVDVDFEGGILTNYDPTQEETIFKSK